MVAPQILTHTTTYKQYPSVDSLPPDDAELMQHAIRATAAAYAPYSSFAVGAALRLADGSIVCGSNQENAAYPSGLCAERTAIFAASASRPDMRSYTAIAIVARNPQGQLCEASPCGACRQVLLEYEQHQQHPMRILCYQPGGSVRELPSATSLLPFSFQLS